MSKELKELKVLIVDDDKTMRKIITGYLKNAGIKNISTNTIASKALKHMETANAANDPFELVLLDINMPGRKGNELLTQIKEHRLLGNTKVIMITSEKDNDTILGCVESGADNYLLKPVAEERLIETIKNLF